MSSPESLQAMAAYFADAKPDRPQLDDYAAMLEEMDRITPVVHEALDRARAIRLGHEIVLYIAGPLTGVDEATKQRYAVTSELIADSSRPDIHLFGYAPHLHGTDPVTHPVVTPDEVRDIDYLWSTVIADGHINFWSPVAHGNGIEAGWAEEHGIPSLHVVPQDVITSRIVRGMHNA